MGAGSAGARIRGWRGVGEGWIRALPPRRPCPVNNNVMVFVPPLIVAGKLLDSGELGVTWTPPGRRCRFASNVGRKGWLGLLYCPLSGFTLAPHTLRGNT